METKLFIILVYAAMGLVLFGLGLVGIVLAKPQVTCQAIALVHITTWEYTMAYIQLCCGGLMLLSTLALLNLFKKSKQRLIVTLFITTLVTVGNVTWAIVGAVSLWNYDMRDCRETLFDVYVMTHIMIVISFLLPIAPITMTLHRIHHIELE